MRGNIFDFLSSHLSSSCIFFKNFHDDNDNDREFNFFDDIQSVIDDCTNNINILKLVCVYKNLNKCTF